MGGLELHCQGLSHPCPGQRRGEEEEGKERQASLSCGQVGAPGWFVLRLQGIFQPGSSWHLTPRRERLQLGSSEEERRPLKRLPGPKASMPVLAHGRDEAQQNPSFCLRGVPFPRPPWLHQSAKQFRPSHFGGSLSAPQGCEQRSRLIGQKSREPVDIARLPNRAFP